MYCDGMWRWLRWLSHRILLSVSGSIPATEPLRSGLNELSDVCQHVLNTFQVSLSITYEINCPVVVQHTSV